MQIWPLDVEKKNTNKFPNYTPFPYSFFNPSLSNSECKISGPSYYGTHLTERMICAYNQGKGTCFGDSGGPLASKVGSSYVLVG